MPRLSLCTPANPNHHGPTSAPCNIHHGISSASRYLTPSSTISIHPWRRGQRNGDKWAQTEKKSSKTLLFFFPPPFLPVFAYFLPNPTFLPPAPRQQSPGDASYEMGAHELMHWGRETIVMTAPRGKTQQNAPVRYHSREKPSRALLTKAPLMYFS